MLPLTVHTGDGSYTQGEEFEKDFTEDEEAENVASGLLEIVPQTYEVIGTSRVFDTEPGETFTESLPLGREALLVAGGHIKRVEAKPPPATPRKRTKKEVSK